MTTWADDDEGRVQVEMGFENGECWLTFNKSTSVVLMKLSEAEVLWKEWGNTILEARREQMLQKEKEKEVMEEEVAVARDLFGEIKKEG